MDFALMASINMVLVVDNIASCYAQIMTILSYLLNFMQCQRALRFSIVFAAYCWTKKYLQLIESDFLFAVKAKSRL